MLSKNVLLDQNHFGFSRGKTQNSGIHFFHFRFTRNERSRLLIVAFTEREDVIRIISARRVTQKEREAYEKAQR